MIKYFFLFFSLVLSVFVVITKLTSNIDYFSTNSKCKNGVIYNHNCYLLSSSGSNCHSACQEAGECNQNALKNLHQSQQPLHECVKLLKKLNKEWDYQATLRGSTYVGCIYSKGKESHSRSLYYYNEQTPTCSASFRNAERLCACKFD